MTRSLIKNGRIITAVDDYQADILIEGERIEAIARSFPEMPDVPVYDAEGLLVFPGGIDVHTHMEGEQGPATNSDTYETGTVAAAFGGTTTIIDFAYQSPGDSAKQTLDARLALADPQVCIDYSFHLILTDVNPGVLSELPDIINNDGISSFKLFMAYPGSLMVNDADIFRVMRKVGGHGGMVNLHAENGQVIQVLIEEALEQGHTSPKYHAITRPRIMEAEAVHRAIRIAELAEIPVYIVHLSAPEALEAIVEARDRGIPAFAETCPHYLFLDDSEYQRPGFESAKFVMTPPLRHHDCQHHLWRGLRFDDLQIVATDHCPFCFKEQTLGMQYSKELGRDDFSKIPNGAPGVELRLVLLYDGGVRSGKINLNRFVQLTSTAPAKMFGLFPQKGTIAVGSDADLVLFNPEVQQTLNAESGHSRMDYSLFDDKVVTGKVEKVFSRGRLIVDGTQWLGETGRGQFLKRSASGQIL